MEVVENYKRSPSKVFILLTGPLFTVVTIAVLTYVPQIAIPICYLGICISLLILIRYFVLLVIPGNPTSVQERDLSRFPSIALIVPCLNERAVLEKTIPEMRRLKYTGVIRFCYIVESSSSDGTLEYVANQAKLDDRIVALTKSTPAAGRGAAIAFGLVSAPRTDIVGFLDSDHMLDQDSLDSLYRKFGYANTELAVQGACDTRNEFQNFIAKSLSLERRVLERLELEKNARLGGLCFFGGGQGFLSRSMLDKPQLQIDEKMILDDIDLSCRLTINGYRIVFDKNIATKSLVPQTWGGFIDQRFRWARGWFDVAEKLTRSVLVCRGLSIPLRIDCIRFITFPFVISLFALFWASAISLVFLDAYQEFHSGFSFLIFWPIIGAVLPATLEYKKKARHFFLPSVLGVPLVFVNYVYLFFAAFVDKYVFRNRAIYDKAPKSDL